jgi:putative ABC transport system permease protein
LKFNVRAIYTADPMQASRVNLGMAFFHDRYLYETIRDSAGSYAGAGTFNVRIANPSQAAAVMRAIDANFENSDVQTKTETEGAFLAEFIELTGNLTSLLNAVGMAVAFAILLVTANTMSMAVRERRTEIAVLKTLGFSGGLVMALVLAEALALGSIGGIVGIGLAQATVGSLAELPFMGFIIGSLTGLSVSPLVAAITFGIAVGLGVAAGFAPAFGAYRARITDMLRQA